MNRYSIRLSDSDSVRCCDYCALTGESTGIDVFTGKEVDGVYKSLLSYSSDLFGSCSISIGITNGKIVLDNIDSMTIASAKIRFCPMCGREIREEEWEDSDE